MDLNHEEEEQYHNKQGYKKPNRKKKKPSQMRDYVTCEDKHKDKRGSKYEAHVLCKFVSFFSLLLVRHNKLYL